MRRNIPVFYVYKGLFGLTMGVWAPIMVLYFTEKGQTLTSFMVLLTMMNVFLVLAAIPSGMAADRYSRKACVTAGSALMTLSLGLMIVTADFALLAASFALWGVGQSLALNADAALLYDSVKALGRESEYQKIAGSASSVSLVATVAGTLVSGFLARRSLDGSMVAGFGALALSTVASLALVEPEFLRVSRSAGARHLGQSFRLVLRNRQVLTLIVVQIVLLRMYNLANRPFAQPALQAAGFDASGIAFLFAGFYVVSALFAKSAHVADRLLGGRENRSLNLLLAMALASLALFACAPGAVPLVLSLVGIFAASGLAGPLLAASLNRRIGSDKRATCLALANMGESALGMVLGPLYGRLSDAYSLRLGMLALLWCFGPLLLLCAALVFAAIRPGARAAVARSADAG
jgi:MFS family permease